MAQFRAKKLDLSCYVNIKVIRDHTKRFVYFSDLASEWHLAHKCLEKFSSNTKLNGTVHAVPRCISPGRNKAVLTSSISQALRYIIRNTTLPQRTRAQAQLQLSQMHAYTRLTQVNNRCILGGKSRGVFSDFRMARV